MSKKHSPFAALTSREQQERWLEFQNTRLPYIEGDVDTTISQEDAEWLGQYIEKAATQSAPADSPQKPRTMQGTAQSQGSAGHYDAQSMQKTRHHQYDAIIRRMKDAEKQAFKFEKSM